jgi:HEAT repeat protein
MRHEDHAVEQVSRFQKTCRILVMLISALEVLALLTTFMRPPPPQVPDSVTARWKTDLMPPLDGLHHANPNVREAAAGSLALQGPKAIPFLPALIEALDDNNEKVRYQAARALGAIGPGAKSAVPFLICHLKNRDEKDRTPFAQALFAMGPEAKTAVPALISVLESHDAALSQSALKALTAIGPAAKPAVPALIRAIKEPNKELVTLGLSALGSIGPEARDAVPELIGLAFQGTKDKDHKTRGDRVCEEAVEALGQIGPDAEAALPRLMEVLTDRKHPMFYSAIETIGNIGPAAEAAVPALTELALDLSPANTVRKSAADAVFKIDPLVAEQLNLETAFLEVHLERIPSIKLAARPRLLEENKRYIRSLIGKLREIESYDDFGFLDSLPNRKRFAPLSDFYYREGVSQYGDSAQFFLASHQRHKSTGAFRELVEMGPVALPVLLDALEDDTPTRLPPTATVVHSERRMPGAQTESNPVNPFEGHIWLQKRGQGDLGRQVINSYRVKVGDVCLAAIRQIVGRDYSAVDDELTTSIADRSSPGSREMRERMRALWAGKNPASRLFDSLLIDFATYAISARGVREESWIQTNAAMRLLYYFPKESNSLVAARLQTLDVRLPRKRANWVSRDELNGVQTSTLIRGVLWCKEPAIQKALADIADRSDDPDIKKLLSVR